MKTYETLTHVVIQNKGVTENVNYSAYRVGAHSEETQE